MNLTIFVEPDGKTVTARNAAGRTLWSVDLATAMGAPVVGEPVVRRLWIEGEQVHAIFGKHGFVTLSIRDGRVLSRAAD